MINTIHAFRSYVIPTFYRKLKSSNAFRSQLVIKNSLKKHIEQSYIYDDNMFPSKSYSKKHALLKQNNIITARNDRQQLYIDTLLTQNPSIVLATGPAGSAKSFLAVTVGIDRLLNNEYKRIVITRPTVPADEDVGYLPGAIDKKMDPWMQPLYDTFYKYYSVSEIKQLIANKVIDICPVAYLRGRTFEDSYIIIDEAQNCTVNQMLMILTRIGPNSKMVITGDLSQHDRKLEVNGLEDFIKRINYYKLTNNAEFIDISHIQFTEDDIVRHPVIKDIMKLYSDKN